LVVSNGTGPAELTFLDASRKTAFFIRLTNGVVSGNTIQFHYATRHPQVPGLAAWVDYTVTNVAGHLWLSGSVTSSVVCCDIPYVFNHLEVRAAFMPALSIRADRQVELRWTSASNQVYQVEYTPDLAQLGWTNVGGLVLGNGNTESFVDSAVHGNAQRFYRIRALP
jgi:hypothetical protein